MWAVDRHQRICSLLATCEQITLVDLAKQFDVSRETLRRDVLQLEAEGRLKRVHGGIVQLNVMTEPPFQSRVLANAEAKRRIGAAAARLVERGMLCAVDAGSTTKAFAAHLSAASNVTVVTNSLDVADAMRTGKGANKAILLGGVVASEVPATFGEVALEMMRRFSPDIGFISPAALNGARGAMNYDVAEAEFARALLENAARVVVLADHSKLGMVSRVQICGCDRIDTVITDRKATAQQKAELTDAGVREVITA